MIFNIGDFLNKILTGAINLFTDLATVVLELLPDSPFLNILSTDEVEEVLGYINYFIPVGTCVAILSAWSVAILGYYVYQAALRWSKAIE